MSALKFVIVFLGFLVVSDNQEYETIEWSAGRKLSWNDFKGDVPINDRAAAITASGISYQFSTKGRNDKIELDYKVSTFFYPNKSWYQKDLCDSVILGHEQLHFDISELYARKMRARLASTIFTSNVKAEVKMIYSEILEILEEYQNRYDKETNFSRNIEQQLIWNKKIKEALSN